jgi:hypothetical protein
MWCVEQKKGRSIARVAIGLGLPFILRKTGTVAPDIGFYFWVVKMKLVFYVGLLIVLVIFWSLAVIFKNLF